MTLSSGNTTGNPGGRLWHYLLRILAAVTLLHGAATFVFAKVVYPAGGLPALLFAQHGFAFIFLALLNLVIWQEPWRGWKARLSLHACNTVFFAFSMALVHFKPEPPHHVAAVLMGGFTFVGLVLERAARSLSKASAH